MKRNNVNLMLCYSHLGERFRSSKLVDPCFFFLLFVYPKNDVSGGQGNAGRLQLDLLTTYHFSVTVTLK